MGLFESIADRRIREARAAGMFDNLPGAGKPIPDLHSERPEGWWAARAVKTERDKIRYEDLQTELLAAMPDLWRLRDEAAVTQRVNQLNEQIGGYNARTSFEPVAMLEPQTMVDRWRAVRSMRQPNSLGRQT